MREENQSLITEPLGVCQSTGQWLLGGLMRVVTTRTMGKGGGGDGVATVCATAGADV